MSTDEIFQSLFLFAAIVFTGWIFWASKKLNVPPAPTLPWVKHKTLKILKSYYDETSKLNVAELGSGWGGLAQTISRVFPASTVTGYEFSHLPFVVSIVRTCLCSDRLRFLRRNFFEVNLEGYDVVVCYLSPSHMRALKDKFEKEMKPGALIVSNAFNISDWTPVKIEYTHVFVKIPIYAYKIGEHISIKQT